jgi:thymidylate synthase
MMGTQNASWLIERAPLWTKFTEADGVTVKGAYGHRWRHHFGGRDQIMDAIHKLHLDPSTRQVNISAWDPAIDGKEPAKNIPCPTNFTLSILDGRLYSSLFLRSSDLFVGLPYDVMAHAMVMNAIRWNLNDMGHDLDLGIMHVTLAHAHLYQKHVPLALEALNAPISVPRHELGKWSVYAIVSTPESFHHYHREQAKKHVWPDVVVRPEVFA